MLKPYDVTSNEVELPDELNTILVDHKLAEPAKNTKLSDARDVFNKESASIDEAARTIGQIMRSADKESDRLKAADMVLKVHGILNELDEKNIPGISIVVNNIGNDNKTLVNLVLPVV
jgi:hypothetical protein